MDDRVVEAEPVVEGASPNHGDHVYKLRVGFTEFGMLWAGRDGCSVRWPGLLDFSSLPLAAWTLRSEMAEAECAAPDVNATFRFTDGVIKRINVASDPLGYEAALACSDRISFARYDLLCGSHVSAAFTAENGKLRRDAHLAILLSRAASWAPRLLEWIVKHHIRRDVIERRINIGRSTERLVELCNAAA